MKIHPNSFLKKAPRYVGESLRKNGGLIAMFLGGYVFAAITGFDDDFVKKSFQNYVCDADYRFEQIKTNRALGVNALVTNNLESSKKYYSIMWEHIDSLNACFISEDDIALDTAKAYCLGLGVPRNINKGLSMLKRIENKNPAAAQFLASRGCSVPD